jgi:predicted CopG family antitoxin
MATKNKPTTIRIYSDTHEELKQRRASYHDSFDEVVRELLKSDDTDVSASDT